MTKEQYKKIAKGAAIAAAGAVLTVLADALPNVDFGAYTPMVVAVLSTAINAARQYINAEV